TALRLRLSVNRCATRRAQAQANSRNLRSLTLPRKNSSIGVGSLHSSHSASVIAVPLCHHIAPRPPVQQRAKERRKPLLGDRLLLLRQSQNPANLHSRPLPPSPSQIPLL